MGAALRTLNGPARAARTSPRTTTSEQAEIGTLRIVASSITSPSRWQPGPKILDPWIWKVGAIREARSDPGAGSR